MRSKTDNRQRMAMIGRPCIGGEFLDVCAEDYGQYRLRRFRRLNTQNDAPRSIDVDTLPGEAMVYDLLSVIEAIIAHMNGATDHGIDLDDHGIDGTYPSLRDRFNKVSS